MRSSLVSSAGVALARGRLELLIFIRFTHLVPVV